MKARLAHALSALDAAVKTVGKVRSIEAVKELHDAAEAQAAAAKRSGLPPEVQHVLAAVSLRAARRAGELLAESPLSHGGRPPKDIVAKHAKTLRELGLNKNQSWRWRRLAAIPKEVFEGFLAESRRSGKAPSAAKLLRLADELKHSGRAKRPKEPLGGITSPEPAVSAGTAPPEFAENLGELQDHLEHFGDLFESLVESPEQQPAAMKRRAASVLKTMQELVGKLRQSSNP